MPTPHEHTGRDDVWTTALSLTRGPPRSAPPSFRKSDVVERVEASLRTVLGVVTTMADDGWLLSGTPRGSSRRYAGAPALLGGPAADVREVLPGDLSDSVGVGTVADRLDTDPPTAYAALRTTPAAIGDRGGGWHLLEECGARE
jgi:hypothetical protein